MAKKSQLQVKRFLHGQIHRMAQNIPKILVNR
jgi:hypothetical protein